MNFVSNDWKWPPPQLGKHTDDLRQFYQQSLASHNSVSPKAVNWRDSERVQMRFNSLTDIADLSGTKILDFGCGNSLLVDYLKDNAINCEYVGWDILPEMVSVSRERYPSLEYHVKDVLMDDISEFRDEFDYILISGVFTVRNGQSKDRHREWYQEILRTLWPLCHEGISVNFMTEYVDYTVDELYYCPFSEFTQFCVEHLSREFTVRHDYDLYEFTGYVYSDPI